MVELSRQVFVQELRGMVPVIFATAVLVVLLCAAYAAGRIYGARHYSRKNMPARAKEKIDELALRLHETETEAERLAAENALLWRRVNGLAAQANRPLDIEQGIREIRVVGRR